MRHLAFLLLVAAFARGADLSTIDRTIKAAPEYAAPEQYYALLVVGIEAKTRIWIVIDGDRLFVDRNGNGDLTEEREQIVASSSEEDPPGLYPLNRSWELPALGNGRCTSITLSFSAVNPTWRPSPTASNRRRMERFMAAVDKIAHPNISHIEMTIDGKREQHCHAMFTTSAETAPIFHVDGPLTIGPLETIMPALLERGADPLQFTVVVGTTGFGGDQPGCISYIMYGEFPADARPLASVEFPGREPGTYLPPRPYELPGKC